MEGSTPSPGIHITDDKKTMTVSDVRVEKPDGTSSLMSVQCVIENKHGTLTGGAYLNVKWNDETKNNHNQCKTPKHCLCMILHNILLKCSF